MEPEARDIQMLSETTSPPNEPMPQLEFPMPAALDTAIQWTPQNTFSMGRIPRPSPRNRRPQRPQRPQRPPVKSKVKKVKPSTSPFAWPAFPLSYKNHYTFSINYLLGGFPRSSVKAVQHFQILIAPPKKPNFFSLKPEDIQKLSAAFFENIRARWAFRRIILVWRFRRCKKVNDEDPMTLEPAKEPIQVYDLYNKAIYTFETKSLARAWKSNLLHHDGMFPEPKFPTNPYTSLPLSPFQIHLAIQSIRKAGYIDWVLDSFASSNYNLGAWEKKFSIPLRVESLTNIFADKSSYDRFDMLMDFAELQYDYHGLEFPKKMFEWIFQKHDVNDYADIWIRACKKYYLEKYTLTDKDDIDELDIRSSIMNCYLIETPIIVKVMYQKYLERIQENGRRRVQARQLQNRVILH
jgi:hypothetical protein